MKIEKPLHNYIDVKINYTCNFKCEYCYQADENGNRSNEVLSKENAENFVKFVKRLPDQYTITLAGGEPFVYPNLEFLVKELTSCGHFVSLITNFSRPLNKIKKVFEIAGSNINNFSISVHPSQRKDMKEFYKKLKEFLTFMKKNKYTTNLFLTCVLTENNVEEVKKLKKKIDKDFDIPLEIQRVYDRKGVYSKYSDKVESFAKKIGLDVPEEKANKIDFYGKKCWSGSKFFYIEVNGDVRRCYTRQKNKDAYELGNLKDYKNIKVFDTPLPCLSKDNGNCICHKHFERQKFFTNIQATEKEIENALEIGSNRESFFKKIIYKIKGDCK